MRLFTATLLLIALAAGCAARTKPPATSEQLSAVHGFDQIDFALKESDGVADKGIADNDPKSLWKFTAIKRHNETARAGSKEARTANAKTEKQADTSRQGFYKLLDYSAWVGGLAFGIGGALLVVSLVNGGGKIGGALGIMALGGSVTLTFMVIRAASPVLPWVAGGLGVILLASVGYFVLDRLRARHQKQERERQLEIEREATVELVDKIDKGQAKPKAELPVSPQTKSLVRKAREHIQVMESGITTPEKDI